MTLQNATETQKLIEIASEAVRVERIRRAGDNDPTRAGMMEVIFNQAIAALLTIPGEQNPFRPWEQSVQIAVEQSIGLQIDSTLLSTNPTKYPGSGLQVSGVPLDQFRQPMVEPGVPDIIWGTSDETIAHATPWPSHPHHCMVDLMAGVTGPFSVTALDWRGRHFQLRLIANADGSVSPDNS